MRLISEAYKGIDWLGIAPSISVVLFFIIFILIIVMIIKFDKKSIAEWEQMPLIDNENQEQEN